MGQIQVLLFGTIWNFFFLNIFQRQLEEPEDPELLDSINNVTKNNYTSNNSKRFSGTNIASTSPKAHDDLEKELLGWYDND